MQGTLSVQVDQRRSATSLPRVDAKCIYGENHSGHEDKNAGDYNSELAIDGRRGG
jgi:hypothetical protein